MFKTRNQACYPLRCSTSVPKNGAHVLDWPDSEQRSALSTALSEVPALFLPSAIFGHIRSEGALLLCVVSLAGLSFICFSS